MKTLRRLALVVIILALLVGSLWMAASRGWMAAPWRPAPSPSPTPVAVSPSPSPSPHPHVLRIGVDDRAACVALYGLGDTLRQESLPPLRLQWIAVPDGQLRWQMLAAGRLDLNCGSLDSYVRSLALAPGVIICRTGTSNGADVLVTAPTISQVTQLKDKTVAVVAGSPGRALMTGLLDQNGMYPSDVRVVEVDSVDMATSLLQEGRVQGAWLWQPYADRFLSRGFHRLNDLGQPPVAEDVCVANAAVLRDRKVALRVFLQAWFEQVSHLESSPRITQEQLSLEISRLLRKTTPPELGNILAGERFVNLEEQRKNGDASLVGALKDLQYRLDRTRSIAVDQLVDLQLLDDLSVAPSSPAPTASPSPTPSPGPSSTEEGPSGSPAAEAASPSPSLP